MAPRTFPRSVLIIFFLIFFICHHGDGNRGITQHHDHQQVFSGGEWEGNRNTIKIQQVIGHYSSGGNNNHHHMHQNPSSSHIDHMKASKIGFFILEDLHVGKTMPISFPNIDFSSLSRFLPRQEADLIPFSSNSLPQLLQLFSYSQGSLQAKQIQTTLEYCELEPNKGETKFCATSLESMLDLVRTILGKENHYKILNTEHVRNPVAQNYTFLQVTEVFSSSNKIVACHILPYPYAVFYCHSQEASRPFKITVGGENGDRVEAAAVCHMDTSDWLSDQMFILLGVKRGTPICHFFSPSNLIWVSY